ncbi:MAG: hypothetical protein K0Q91_1441 [Fibrobacteria bacterium]|jgi:hypothetical protein|nr:hypothetical protein [Fibrobacteria bacterium]
MNDVRNQRRRVMSDECGVMNNHANKNPLGVFALPSFIIHHSSFAFTGTTA